MLSFSGLIAFAALFRKPHIIMRFIIAGSFIKSSIKIFF